MGLAKSKPKITSQDRAILDLKGQRDRLHQYQKKLQAVLDRESAMAREQLRLGNKKRALLALKRKKYQEQLIEKAAAQMMNLEELVNSIEYALVEKQIFDGLRAGNEVLTTLHKETSIEAVQQLMDDTADAIAYQNEVDEVISGKISEEDEAAVLAELEQIEKEAAAEAVAKLPDAPQEQLPTRLGADGLSEASADEKAQAQVQVAGAAGSGDTGRKRRKEEGRTATPVLAT